MILHELIHHRSWTIAIQQISFFCPKRYVANKCWCGRCCCKCGCWCFLKVGRGIVVAWIILEVLSSANGVEQNSQMRITEAIRDKKWTEAVTCIFQHLSEQVQWNIGAEDAYGLCRHVPGPQTSNKLVSETWVCSCYLAFCVCLWMSFCDVVFQVMLNGNERFLIFRRKRKQFVLWNI